MSSYPSTPAFSLAISTIVNNGPPDQVEKAHQIIREEMRSFVSTPHLVITPASHANVLTNVPVSTNVLIPVTAPVMKLRRKSRRGQEKKYIPDGARVRHLSGSDIRTGIFSTEMNSIGYNGEFMCPSKFALMHHHSPQGKPSRKSAGGWEECEAEINGVWIKLIALPPL